MSDARAVIETYARRLGRQHAIADDPDLARPVALLREKFDGQVVAILLYGSYLRGARDTLLDFYVVVDSYAAALDSRVSAIAAWLLPPNVYYLAVGEGEERLRAKYAVVTLAQLQREAVVGMHPYFWARFAQPCNFVYVRDKASKLRLLQVCEQCVRTFVRRVAPMLQGSNTTEHFWSQGFALTYKAELRAESAGRVDTLFEHHAAYYSVLLERLADDQHLIHEGNGRYRVVDTDARSAAIRWGLVIALGKVLSLARLIKGAVTFDDPVDYILWKIERHSGIKAQATARQRRYPLVFVWPLVWRLYRQGAFR